MSKRLIFSDVHLNTWQYGATVDKDGYNSRLGAQRAALTQIVQTIDAHNIKYVYFGGDLFHTHSRIPTQALCVAAEFIGELKYREINFRAIPGNHDFEDKAGKIHALQWLSEESLRGYWRDAGLVIVALPYTEDKEVIKRFLGEIPPGSMALLHQGVNGVPLSSGYVLDESLTPEMIPDHATVFTGHYHFHKRVKPNLTVIGNLTPLNWSDIDQQKGFIIWDDQTKEQRFFPQKYSPAFMSWNNSIAKHSDISNVKNAFVRWTEEIKQGDQEGIRKELIKEGALTVEFPKVEIEIGSSAIRTGEDITVEHLVKTFETKDMEPRRIKVGQEIREEKYET